jgi:hypothetical protein
MDLWDIVVRWLKQNQKSRNTNQSQETQAIGPTILISDLPGWAQRAVLTARMGNINMLNGDDSLNVNKGIAFFNGKRVVRRGESVKPFASEIQVSNLPEWAQKEIRKTAGGGHIVQMNRGDGNLQIRGDIVYFNGVKVVK